MKKKGRINLMLVAIVIVAAILVWIFYQKAQGIQEKELVTANYSIKYDTTWKVEKSDDSEVVLKHKDTKSTIDISVAEIDSDLYGKSIKQIADNIKVKINDEYKNYKCISEGTTSINESIGEAYQLLFEDGKNQSLIVIGMHGYKLVISNYTAKNQYFDILLDSVQNINSNMVILDKSVDLMDTSDIAITGMNVKKGSKEFNDVKNEKIYGSYYYVEYTVPQDFYNSDISIKMTGKVENDSEVSIGASIESNNIFEVFEDMERDAKSQNYYKNFETEKVNNGDLKGYCLKYQSRKNNKEYYNYVYILDNYNTLKIDISGENITQNLIDSIKVLDHKRYGNYIDRTTTDGYYVGSITSGWFVTSGAKKVKVTYKVPDKYYEIVEPTLDLGAPEHARSFIYGKLRNDEIEVSDWYTDPFYDYNITISVENGSLEKRLSRMDEGTKYQKDVTIEGVTYKYYTSEYNSEGTIIKSAHLYAELDNGENDKCCYHVDVSSLDEIPMEVLQDFAASKIEVGSFE